MAFRVLKLAVELHGDLDRGLGGGGFFLGCRRNGHGAPSASC